MTVEYTEHHTHHEHINPDAYFVPRSVPIPNLVSVCATPFLTVSLCKAVHVLFTFSSSLTQR